MAPAKLSETVRRNELLLLASLLAGLLMALFEMIVGLVAGGGLWAFPGYVAATVFRSMQAGGTLAFSMPQIATGLALHLALAVLVGVVFGWMAPRLRNVVGLGDVDETPAYGLLGLGFGLAVFAVAWWGVLPYVNPIMVEGLDPTFFAIAHGIWGLCLGVTRRAWTQTAPVTRRASASPRPTPAASGHKAPSGATAASPSPSSAEADVATLEPDEHEKEEEEASSAEDGDDEMGPVEAAGGDDLSPWPDPPEETPDEEEASDEDTSTDNGYASTSARQPGRQEGDEDEEGLAMTEHARRSLRGLTDREPDLPPVHKALDTTLTHVAPGRAVCTLDADERLHDATGAVQSGLLISLGELAATIAMETVAPEAQHATVASEVQVEGFVEEGHVVAEAEVTEQAGTTTLAEVEVRDASGQVLVAASFQAVTDDGQ